MSDNHPPNVVDLQSRKTALRLDTAPASAPHLGGDAASDEARRRRYVNFPDEWKDLAGEILDIFVAQPENFIKGRPMTPIEIRDAIMIDDDTVVDGKRVRNERLKRQDIINWRKGIARPGNQKFWFIDSFIRKIQLSEAYDSIRHKIISGRERRNIEALSNLYHNHSWDIQFACEQIASRVGGRIFSTTPINQDEFASGDFKLPYIRGKSFKQMVMQIEGGEGPVFVVRLMYCSSEIGEVSIFPDSKNYITFFGYLIPILILDDFIECIVLGFNRDQFSNFEHEMNFPASSAMIHARDSEIYLRMTGLIDDPDNDITSTHWKYRGTKSIFSGAEGARYPDYTMLKEEPFFRDLAIQLSNLPNSYLIW